MYDLGIIGGMGSDATVEMFRKIVSLTNVTCDQDHLSICILNKPQIPDRTNYVVHAGPSPLPMILDSVNELRSLGARHYIIPCNTAHIFANQLGIQEDIKFIDMIKVTKSYLYQQYKGQKVCILGTFGTAKARIYGNEYSKDEEVVLIYPNEKNQTELMDIIYSVKNNKHLLYENLSRLIDVIKQIKTLEGECVFLIACTELSVIISDCNSENIKYVDAMELLAINAIMQCGYKVNAQKTKINVSKVPMSI